MIGYAIDRLFSAWTSRRMQSHLPYPPSRTALLLVDVQNAFVEPDHLSDTPFYEVSQSIGWFENLREFTKSCRKKGVHVAHAPFQVPTSSEGDSQSPPIPFVRRMRDAGLLTEDREGVGLPQELVEDEDLELDDRTVLNVFYGTDLERELEKCEISHLLVCGSFASAGVDSTGRMGVELDYDVTFVSDCVAAWDQDSYEASIKVTFPRMGNRVLESQEVLKQMA